MQILIVDDEPLLVRSFVRLLKRLGHTALSASGGEEALELLTRERVDVVLCDVRMPRGDGPSLVKGLRARGDLTPLLFLTGYADFEDAALAAMGAQGVLSKPIELAALEAALRRVTTPP